jgi:hypothetical protein
VGPQQSDVRALGSGTPNDQIPFELGQGSRLHAPLQPPPLGVGDALVQYGAGLPENSEVLRALQLDDLPRAVVLLLHANHLLNQQLEGSRADFDELRAINVAIEERVEQALGVADDQRLQLIAELERTHDAVFLLETQLEQDRTCYEGDLERCRQECAAAKSELLELETEFSEYQARLWPETPSRGSSGAGQGA